ncbi:MAG: hypothetical protein COA53_06540 [Rhodobacteraceae bacterium]|nr:MAG: hypothetical protein COA53_06540 [Paracoccaceae bacterium]
MTKDFDDFDKDTHGNIILHNVVSSDSFLAYGMNCGLRFLTCRDAAHHKEVLTGAAAPESVQLILTPDQAELIAKDLLESSAQCRLVQTEPN